MTGAIDFDRIKREVEWLKKHPEFDEMPATIKEFLGPDYLNFTTARPGLVEALEAIFGDDVNADRISLFERAMITGAIGIGKTTFASLCIPYMVHWILCLKDPQGFYGFASGSRIAFMQMSTTAKNALEVIFGDLKARIDNSKWFLENYPYDPAYTKQMRFPKNIWVLPGDSLETSFEGYNILGGILDEMDSHKITAQKNYAEDGFNTIESRIASRFPDFSDLENQGHKGLLVCIGQMKSEVGFANKKYNDMLKDKKAYVKRMTIWESFGWDKYTRSDGTRASFWYDIKTKKLIPPLLASHVKNDNLIEIPLAYKKQFENNPEKALRDLAGIPPKSSDTFISLVDRIEECRNRWVERVGYDSPVKPRVDRVEFEDWFQGRDPRRRALHIDFAKGGDDGDALGMAMGYVDHLITIDGEEKPYIVIDCLMRIRVGSGQEIFFQDVRNVIYHLKDDLHFRLKRVTMDGFQSTDTFQQLRKRKFSVDYLSADKTTAPYEDLRDAIYERRIEFPRFMTYMHKGDTELVEIAVQEIMRLEDTGKKIDHPAKGSKDVADAIACVTYELMGDRSYRRGAANGTVSPTSQLDEVLKQTGTDGNVLQFPGMLGGNGLQAPVPPSGTGILGLTIPDRLKPRGR